MRTTDSIISQINNNELDERLLEIYVDNSLIEEQKARYIKALNSLKSRIKPIHPRAISPTH